MFNQAFLLSLTRQLVGRQTNVFTQTSQAQKVLLRLFSVTTTCTQKSADVAPETSQTDPSQASPAVTPPVILSRESTAPPGVKSPRLAWVESLNCLEGKKVGMVDLHPDVFAVYPRIDILHKNIYWQKFYRHIDYNFEPSRAELPGGGRKPWPQKGMGRARHGSIRSPLWIRGAKAHGPRGPKSYFYMLSRFERALGLRVALSCKYAQDDLVVVDSLDLPTSDSKFLTDLADVRFWGYSVLFVDDNDVMPENLVLAMENVPGFNAMPVYGLNVHSMLKHDTLVLTLAALEKVEHKLLTELHSTQRPSKYVHPYTPEDYKTRPDPDHTMHKLFSRPLEP